MRKSMKKSIFPKRKKNQLSFLKVLAGTIVLVMLFTSVCFSEYLPIRGDIGVHDPVMIKAGGSYYVYGTGANIPFKISTDGINWRNSGVALPNPPSWIKTYIPQNNGSDMWAPDISYRNGVYYLYYAVSSFGSNTSAIGLATNVTLDPKSPNYKWVDRGMVIRSTNANNYNCIDPNCVVDNNGTPWLSFGSFWSGIKLVELNPDTGLLKSSNPQIYSIASRPGSTAVEAPFTLNYGGYYYLFASFDMCCKGVNSTYKIAVGRSKSVTGPYVDMSGKDMMQGGGTILDAGDNRWKGPGHNGICIDGNRVLLINHAYDANNNGAPTMQIRPIYFNTGWPSFTGTDIIPTPTKTTFTPTPTPTWKPTPTPTQTPLPTLSGTPQNGLEFNVSTVFSPERLIPNQMLTARVTASNTSDQAYPGKKDVLVIVGLYDSNSTMVNVSYISKEIAFRGTETLSAGFKLPSDIHGYSARAFMWDGTDLKTTNMIPLSNVTQIKE